MLAYICYFFFHFIISDFYFSMQSSFWFPCLGLFLIEPHSRPFMIALPATPCSFPPPPLFPLCVRVFLFYWFSLFLWRLYGTWPGCRLRVDRQIICRVSALSDASTPGRPAGPAGTAGSPAFGATACLSLSADREMSNGIPPGAGATRSCWGRYRGVRTGAEATVL